MNTANDELRQRFYEWMSCYETISYSTIKRVARNYLAEHGEQPSKAENILFWPLVQLGVVTFAGAGTYKLTPRTVYQLSNGTYLIVNGRSEEYSVVLYPGLHFSDLSNVGTDTVLSFRLEDYLPLIKPARTIIKNWRIGNQNDYKQALINGKWVPADRIKVNGCYLLRMSELGGTNKAVVINQKCYAIPPFHTNPPAYALAEMAVNLHQGKQLIRLNKNGTSVATASVRLPAPLLHLFVLEHINYTATVPQFTDKTIHFSVRPDAVPSIQAFININR